MSLYSAMHTFQSSALTRIENIVKSAEGSKEEKPKAEEKAAEKDDKTEEDKK